MAYENKNYGENRGGDQHMESIYSKRVKAGKRRTYFFDVRSTRGSDYFITITESKKRSDDNGYDRHKMFLYKEDFNKFLAGLAETIAYVKTDLMPDFDFDAFKHEPENEERSQTESSSLVNVGDEALEDVHVSIAPEVSEVIALNDNTSVDDWKM